MPIAKNMEECLRKIGGLTRIMIMFRAKLAVRRHSDKEAVLLFNTLREMTRLHYELFSAVDTLTQRLDALESKLKTKDILSKLDIASLESEVKASMVKKGFF